MIYNTGPAWLNILSMATMVAIVVLAIQRLGLLAITVAFFILFVVGGAILTFDHAHGGSSPTPRCSRWFRSRSPSMGSTSPAEASRCSGRNSPALD